ncbi:sam35p [Saccharomyces arboricola H-6]|uniref:Sam35p n=1 Tax=Saccharomyces arboricola (strain H-6 / AS 2.3317 / CBS 10644) TaxID=1160507 RepID=J8PMV0_SACAR|nr:sam35p [Saccharomyces arboricola H-6]
MMSLFSVPMPVKRIFDTFPVRTYPAQADRDEAVVLEVDRRSYAFTRGDDNDSKLTAEDTYKLGVYNVFLEATTKTVLATDPCCLFVQLALCQKNGVQLPTQSREQGLSRSCNHELVVLSRLSNPDETLPILVEGYKKRIVRSTGAISESVRSRMLDDSEQLMYHTLLDTVLYDCWITQVLFCSSNAQFMELYSSQKSNNSVSSTLDVGNSLLNKLSVNSLKMSLLMRNKFQLRHREIVKGMHAIYHNHHNTINQEQALNVLFENSKQILSDFKLKLKRGGQPTSLDLKIASYILCIINVKEPIKLKIFIENECNELVSFAQEVLQNFVQ